MTGQERIDGDAYPDPELIRFEQNIRTGQLWIPPAHSSTPFRRRLLGRLAEDRYRFDTRLGGSDPDVDPMAGSVHR